MTDGKTKIYTNPNRNRPVDYKPYVPQHQVHGIEPQEYKGAILPGNVKIAGPSPDNPRLKRAPLRQPYAETTISPIGRGRGPVPNVGNNMEHTWSSVDGEIVDDLTGELNSTPFDPNKEMIDNNDFVSDQAFGFQNGINADDIQPQFNQGQVVIEGLPEQFAAPPHQSVSADDLLSVVSDLEDNLFLLIVTGIPVCSGPKEEIEDQARALVFGEHEMCDGNPIPIDDIIIIKRIKVKVGLFLE
jgi:hypothetical protein